MTRDQLFEFHQKLCADAESLMRRKNADYSKADTFGNLKSCEAFQICEAETGILVRLTDKFSRLATLIQRPPECLDESFRDTIIDVINYAVLMAAIRESRTMPPKSVPSVGMMAHLAEPKPDLEPGF